MKKRIKKILTLLAITIAFSIPLYSAYFHYSTLVEADLLSSGLSFENSNQENLTFGDRNQSKELGQNDFAIVSLLETNLFKQAFHVFFRPLSLEQKKAVLRC